MSAGVLVAIAATVQGLLAAAFVAAATVALRWGDTAQRAADAVVVGQGYPPDLLARHRIRYAETPLEALLPLGIAATLLVVAVLNAGGNEAGRIATWIVQPLLLVAGGFVTASQVFADRVVASALRRSPEAAGIDADAVNAAARSGFPAWLRGLLVTRFLLTTAGSVLVLVLVSLPTAAAHYR